MGADLIGYFAKGPQEINPTPEQKSQIVTQLMQLRDWLAPKLAVVADDLPDDGSDAKTVEQVFTPEVMAAAPVLVRRLADLQEMKEVLELLAPEDEPATIRSLIAELVDELLSEWPPNFRDSSWIPDPDDDTQVIAFAGERTWGDEPDGAGFQLLKKMALLGVGEPFGIRVGCSFCTITLV